MTYSYMDKDRIKSASIIGNFKFVVGKISFLYFLHIATMLLMLPFQFFGEAKGSVSQIITRLLLNISLLQEWFPLEHRSINGVSWYLSTTVFLYFMFPYILKIIEKKNIKYKPRKTALLITLLFCFQIAICFIAGKLPYYEGTKSINPDLTNWIIYHFPPVRLIDFSIGCLLCCLYLSSRDNQQFLKDYRKSTILEAITVLFIFIGCILYLFGKSCNIGNSSPNRWWTYSVIFTLTNCMFIILSVSNNGAISRLLTNRIILKIAPLTNTAFLIHYVILRYMDVFLRHINRPMITSTSIVFIKIIVGFPITIILCILVDKARKTNKYRIK